MKNNIPKEIIEDKMKFFTLTVENDLFGAGTDQNYTSGVRFNYFDTSSITPLSAQKLDYMLPFFQINNTTSVYYALGQNLYTPDDIKARVPDPSDRPYAGFLYGALGMTTLSGDHIDDLEITVGVIGPWALGEETQEFVHDLGNFDDPSGWSYQLENEPALNLAWQRQWPEAYASHFGSLYFRASPHVGVSIGNIYTYASSGLSLQFTPFETRWQSKPLRVRPAIPGNGLFAVPENHLSWSIFAGVEGRAVARNIFLDGNTWEDGPSVNKKPFVADANVGVSLSYGKTQVSYTLNWRSKEFDGQDDPSIFGAISVGYRF